MSTPAVGTGEFTTTKSGKGLNHGVVSEVSAFFHVRPGHGDALRQACKRFHQKLLQSPPQFMQKFGLRDMRHVIFDNDTRLCWMTAFETDWQPYIDDSVNTMGLATWHDWFQHCEECPEEFLKFNNEELRTFIQSGQVRATGFFRTISDLTLGQIWKHQRLQKAFDQVLDSPGAEEALQQPVLKPLLDEAAG